MRRPSSRARDAHGFTLIEVLVAITLLLIGVLGVASLVNGANAVTSKTKAREGGTNLARSIIEVSRSIRYRDLTANELLDALQSRAGLGDAKPLTAGYTIHSRNVDYELTLTVCSLDDPKDNLGSRPTGVTFCPDSDAMSAGDGSRDRNPDDYKRVRVTLVWTTRSTTHSITQTSAIINPVGGLGPSVTALTMTSPTSNSDPLRIESSAATVAGFAATTSTSAAQVNWSVNGDVQGKASGSGTGWNFSWDLEKANGTPAFYDCTYVIQTDALDGQGRAGAPRAVTVILNRLAPLAPAGFEGGRNGDGNRVDVQWLANPECDVAGYRVYRSDLATALGSPVTCLGQPAGQTFVQPDQTSCVDESAPGGTLYYRVVAIDTAPGGGLREGSPSAQLTVTAASARPSTPDNLVWCVGGQPGCEGPDGQPAPDGVIVLSWDPSTDPDGNVAFYRIYRDGTGYPDRHDVFFPSGGLAWFEYDADGTSHTYRVSAVDNTFTESGLSSPVSAP